MSVVNPTPTESMRATMSPGGSASSTLGPSVKDAPLAGGTRPPKTPVAVSTVTFGAAESSGTLSEPNIPITRTAAVVFEAGTRGVTVFVTSGDSNDEGPLRMLLMSNAVTA